MPITQTSLKSKNYNALGIDEIADDISNIITVVNAMPESPTTAIVNISSAQILAMGTTPKQLLPAPGIGMYYDIEKYVIEYTNVTTGYSFAANDLIAIYYNGGSYVPVVQIDQFPFSQSANSATLGVPTPEKTQAAGGFATNPKMTGGNIFNLPLVFGTWSGTNPTLGNGTIRAIITYTVRTFGA